MSESRPARDRALPDSARAERVAREFTVLYEELREQTFGYTRWLGQTIVKCPTDLVVLQEIVEETRPDLIVETGVYGGGSTFFFATLMDQLGIDGRVIAIDIDLLTIPRTVIDHPRVKLIQASSTDPAVVAQVREAARDRRVMVDLDSDHSAGHVLEELRAYAPLVSPGCYLVVEDTWLSGRPIDRDSPGPTEALEGWMAEADQPFEVDRWRERFLLTGNPRGYLRRVGDDDADADAGRHPRAERFVAPEPGPLDDDGAEPRERFKDRDHELASLRRSVAALAEGERRHRELAAEEFERARAERRGLYRDLARLTETLEDRERELGAARARLRQAERELAAAQGSLPQRAYRSLVGLPGLRGLAARRARRRSGDGSGRQGS